MAISARLLSVEDLPKLKILLEEQPTMFGEENPYSPTVRWKYIASKIGNQNESQYIAEDDGKILSFARQIFLPYAFVWLYTSLVVKKGFAAFSPRVNGVAAITTTAIKEAENKGYNSYIFVTRVGKGNRHGFRRMQKAIPILHRYEYYDEAILKAGQPVTMERYARLIVDRIYSHDLLVRVGMLKNEFRQLEKIHAK